MNRRKIFQFMLILILMGAIAITLPSSAMAGIGTYIVKDSSATCHEYGLMDLINSYNAGGPLWLEFESEMTAYGIHAIGTDNQNKKYVDFSAILNAVNNNIDVLEYIDSSDATLAAMPGEVDVVSLGENGQLVHVTKPVETVTWIVTKVENSPLFGSTTIKVVPQGASDPSIYQVSIDGISIPLKASSGWFELAVTSSNSLALKSEDQLKALLQTTIKDATEFKVDDIY